MANPIHCDPRTLLKQLAIPLVQRLFEQRGELLDRGDGAADLDAQLGAPFGELTCGNDQTVDLEHIAHRRRRHPGRSKLGPVEVDQHDLVGHPTYLHVTHPRDARDLGHDLRAHSGQQLLLVGAAGHRHLDDREVTNAAGDDLRLGALGQVTQVEHGALGVGLSFADEIIVLDQGEIAERGTHEQLMALNGSYAAMVHREHEQAQEH